MNDNHPYDKWLGDKLRKLPVPDADKSWPEMRRLLDEDMPEGGGYSKRRGGWWFFGALLIFIIAGSWTLLTMNFSRQNVDPPLTNTKNTSPPKADQAKVDLSNQTAKPVAEDDKILLSKFQEQDNPAPQTINGEPLTEPRSIGGARSAKPADDELRKDEAAIPGNSTSNSKSAGADNPRTARVPGVDRSTEPTPIMNDPSLVGGDDEDGPAYAHINGILPLPVGSVALRYDSLGSAHSDKMDYTYVSRKYYRQHKKYGRPANVKSPYTTAGRSFAIGFSLPMGFPLGDQKMLGYNINAGGNTASDYLPAPHLQYHFNGKAYLQSELQLMSPQFIRPVLLYQDHRSNNNYSTTSSVYARKLYYFNVPVSLHYSPFKHFYMGTGLQFSSLLSGVALHEQLRTGMVSGDSIYTTQYSKFSNDSISGKLNSNEMRLMLDANYYWNRFTVGLRYNQALSNYVSTRAAPAVPYTLDKNKSLQFYMRYNLWEDKKWKSRNTRLLTLK